MEREIRHLLGLEHISPDIYRKITRHNALCGIGCAIAMILYAIGEFVTGRGGWIGRIFSVLYILTIAASLVICVKTVRGTFDHPRVTQVYGQFCLFETVIFGMATSVARMNTGDHFMILLTTVVGGLCLFRIRPIVSLGAVGILHCALMYVAHNYNLWATHFRFSYIVFLAMVELVSLVGWYTSLSNFVQEGNMADANTILQQDNETWRNASVRDSLTGLFNRYGLNRNSVLWRGRPICVMMADVDNFKHYNDAYGHEAGDMVLKRFANVLIDSFGDAACYRYGGDEFLVVSDMPPLQFLEMAKKAQEKMREKAENDQIGPISTSMGFVYGRCLSEVDLPDFIRQADRKLYQVKESGKGAVQCGAFITNE
ncbi:MAG: GGDEF domain-containing protein [Lactimicrobium sp.]|jgi:diguanylate cyclase (GGDEF)-like protein|uniref:GGDEF domain-containing protein n=1 Tax=Lactimicrobium sp. TaxID=2563780 RepID=UPI002F35D4F4